MPTTGEKADIALVLFRKSRHYKSCTSAAMWNTSAIKMSEYSEGFKEGGVQLHSKNFR